MNHKFEQLQEMLTMRNDEIMHAMEQTAEEIEYLQELISAPNTSMADADTLIEAKLDAEETMTLLSAALTIVEYNV